MKSQFLTLGFLLMPSVSLASRLSTMLYYLNRGYTVNIKQLSEAFSIGERQIQKYSDAICQGSLEAKD